VTSISTTPSPTLTRSTTRWPFRPARRRRGSRSTPPTTRRDLDLFVYLDGDLVDLSATGGADEQVTLLAPADGTYDVFVNGFATPGGSTTYTLYNFVVPSTDAGNTTLSPDPVTPPAELGDQSTVTASWAGLDASKRWLGVISYAGTDDVTLLSVG
jgi:hypothetical protein